MAEFYSIIHNKYIIKSISQYRINPNIFKDGFYPGRMKEGIRKGLKWGIRVGLAAILLSCKLPTDPIPLDTVVRYEPLPIYSVWWKEGEDCTGRKRDMNEIEWGMVPGTDHFRCKFQDENGTWYESDNCAGLYTEGHKITVGELQIDVKGIILHEMLHAFGLKHADPDFYRCLSQDTINLRLDHYDDEHVSIDYIKGSKLRRINIKR